MNCNAHNHPPDCNCGWGGVFHGAGDHSNALQWPTTQGSFINPNARCPVCDAQVFFYRSPEGGRVFFDALGQPWPKHPCTANESGSVIPSSAYWKAMDVLTRANVKQPPLSVLSGSQKLADQWLMGICKRWISHGNLRHVVAIWASRLPPPALGVADIDFGLVNSVLVAAMARAILQYFQDRNPNKAEAVCLELARAVIERRTAKNAVQLKNPLA